MGSRCCGRPDEPLAGKYSALLGARRVRRLRHADRTGPGGFVSALGSVEVEPFATAVASRLVAHRDGVADAIAGDSSPAARSSETPYLLINELVARAEAGHAEAEDHGAHGRV